MPVAADRLAGLALLLRLLDKGLASSVARYSTLALISFVAVAASGVVSAAVRLDGWSQLQTAYGALLIGKVIAHGEDRKTAIARMRMALDEMVLNGIKTNIPLHKWLLLDPGFIEGGFNIHYLEKRLAARASG